MNPVVLTWNFIGPSRRSQGH